FNDVGDRSGCYRVYQGALLSVRPMLDHRPALQEAITKGLAAAHKTGKFSEGAFVLRKVIDEVRAELARPAAAPTTTLWDRLGGDRNVARVVDELVGLAAKNPKVNYTLGGKFKFDEEALTTLKKSLVEFVSAATGGPLKYSGRSMKDAHKGLGITNAEFDALAFDLQTALRNNGATSADIAAVLKAVEGTRQDIIEEKKKADGK